VAAAAKPVFCRRFEIFMTSRRLLKAAEAVREVIAMALLRELKDPRVQNVTVISVEVMPDMKQAKVYVSIMGDEKQQRLALHGLQSSAGFLQHLIADRIETRYTPRLEFVLDPGVKNQLAIEQILRRVLPQDEAAADAETPATAEPSAEASSLVDDDSVAHEVDPLDET
jgi:ribosome-binding factor A